MSLTVFPTIVFNSGTGSDTAASGAGPATALSGSAGAVTSSSTSATIGDAVDLSGVATDGSAVLWINTASGRQFSRISAVSGSSGAWTLTLENSVWTTSTSKTWGIGGKRALFNATSSRLLFSADALPGWTIQTETDQTGITSSIACTALGSTSGLITLKGDSTSTKRLLSSATNNVSLLSGGLAYWAVKNFKFTSTAATKTTSYGFEFNTTNSNGITIIQNCVLGDPVGTLRNGVFRNGAGNPFLQLINCEIQYCLGYGFDGGGGSSGTLTALYCKVHDNASGGGQLIFSLIGATVEIIGCEFYNNTGIGFEFIASSTTSRAVPHVVNNTFHNNSSDGIKIGQADQLVGAIFLNNNITKNGGYGINYAGSNGDALKGFIDFNNFGTGALANTSGAVNGFTQGPNSITVDPTYTNASTGDFTPGNAATQIAYAVGAAL